MVPVREEETVVFVNPEHGARNWEGRQQDRAAVYANRPADSREPREATAGAARAADRTELCVPVRYGRLGPAMDGHVQALHAKRSAQVPFAAMFVLVQKSQRGPNRSSLLSLQNRAEQQAADLGGEVLVGAARVQAAGIGAVLIAEIG